MGVANETLNKMTAEDGNEIALSQFGFQSATKTSSNPESIKDKLDSVYRNFLIDQGKNKGSKIEQLKNEIELEAKRKNQTEANNIAYDHQKEQKNEELKQLSIEKRKIIETNGEVGDISTFVIGAFITLSLTMYLFVFYSSSGYSAFYGIKPGSLGFINPNVFGDAMNKGGGVIALIVLFPVIFLGLGFLIHDSLETNKKLKKEGKKESYTLIITLLIITLVADMFIGYKISQGVHANEFNQGLANETWKFKMIFSDINFYLVLVLGFVVYVVWGFLLNRVLSHSYLKTEDEITKILLEEKDKEIANKREDINQILARITESRNNILTHESTISRKEDILIRYETVSTPVDVTDLRSTVGEFMSGWENFTIGFWGKFSSEKLLEARKIKDEWLDTKIQNLKSEN